jgi:hypothetical protein
MFCRWNGRHAKVMGQETFVERLEETIEIYTDYPTKHY